MSDFPARAYSGPGTAVQSALPAGMALAMPVSYAADEVYVSAEEDHPPGMPLFDTVASDPVVRHFGASYGLLERSRPDVASLARFAHRVEVACFYMCVAFEQGGLRDFAIDAGGGGRSPRGTTWFAAMADTTFYRFKLLRRALTHAWTPPAEVEPLTYSAFHSLCDLTPESGHHLKLLYSSRREAAIESLMGQLDLKAQILEKAVALASWSDDALSGEAAEEDAARTASIQSEILADAGETLSLRDAARRLGTSHQALHKRIQTGSALGVMHGRELLIPTVQFVAGDRGEKVVPGLKQVVGLFEAAGAGNWSALQFLTTHDPLLAGVPIARLKDGNVDAVVHAARAYLGLEDS